MKFISFEEVATYFRGKTVAIVGSAPSCLNNDPGFVDSHDLVVRVNNYRCGPRQGFRTSIHYSFFGTSIRTSAEDLIRDGVKLCMNKLPNSRPLNSAWHERHGKLVGIDYKYIFVNRANWWPCDVFIPDDARFLRKFELLGNHQPTTGFAAILDVLECEPASIMLTGFDFFKSGIHNVNEPWKQKNNDDPICHRPDLEMAWLRANADKYPMTFDQRLTELLGVAVTV